MNTQLGWTDLEQSKKLVEAGLDPNTADMHIIDQNYGNHGYFDTALCYSKWDATHTDGYFPCWSLGRLLELIPHFINMDGVEYQLDIYPDGVGYWNVDYVSCESDFRPIDYYDESLLDAVFYMMCHMLEQGFIAKGEVK